MASSILIFGHDGYLLRSRQWLLESKNIHVYLAQRIVEASRIILTLDISLVVLCQTLSPEECNSISALASAMNPPLKVLVIDFDCVRNVARDKVAFLNEFPNPKKLLKTVEATLQESCVDRF